MTNLWRLFDVWGGRFELTQKLLHENMVSLNDPDLIDTIYGIKGNWVKFYHGNSTDNAEHARMKRPIAKFYSLNGVLPIEPHIDSNIKRFCQRLEEEYINGPNAGKPCNLGDWLLYYTWDVVGEATFSKPIGFLEKGAYINDTLKVSEKALDYFALVESIIRMGPPSFSFITQLSIKFLQARLTGEDQHDPSKPDFLDKFLEAKKTHPDIVDDLMISYLLINMIAGADTMAITLLYRRLQKELDEAGFSTPVSYKDARTLPYMDAVIREAMRMHPGVGMPLERRVPEGGLHVAGHYIPPGAMVGMNPSIVGANRDVYGQDAAVFRPERWLQEEGETAEEYEARLQRMNSCDLTFGGRSRICIGKNLALLEVYKVIPTLFSLYEIELADPKKEWKIQNSWFVRQEGIEVRLSRRK
ncbi:putative PDA-like cytochrome P450 monooxygenase [Thermoascus aurantiacus ATCC 26904]